METWYLYKSWKSKYGWITPVQVEKHTNQSVWIDGRVNRRWSEYGHYFPTFQDAQAFAIKDGEQKISNLKDRINLYKLDLAEIRAEQEETK